MTVDGDEARLYEGREQTLVKHYILRQYLVTFAHKVASFSDALTYVDCFSGPWNAVSEELRDSSFSIAIEELRKARDTYAKLNREIRLRCFFIEKNRSSYRKLKSFADGVADVEVETINASFEKSIDAILTFVRSGGSRNFPFLFIDPTGWSGFAMNTIEPLLKLNPVEILVNFMTSHIRRFVDSPQEQTQASFREMFGSDDFQAKVHGLALEDREDALISEYMTGLKRRGSFNYVAAAIVLDPHISRTAFHLIYATRNRRGLEVFKAVEKRAMAVMVESQREIAVRQQDTSQGTLFRWSDLFTPKRYELLRQRYTQAAQDRVMTGLARRSEMSYEDAWKLTVAYPLVWDSDLKNWIKTWQRDERVEIIGLSGKQRVPQLDKGHRLRFRK